MIDQSTFFQHQGGGTYGNPTGSFGGTLGNTAAANGSWFKQLGQWGGQESFLGGGITNMQLAGAGMGVANMGVNLLAGNNHTKVGDIMQTVGGIASNIPGVGGLIGGAVGVVGGLINAAFGSSINEEFVNQTKSQTNALGSQVFNSNTNADVLNDWQNMTAMSHVRKSEVGSDGWFSSDAEDTTDDLNRKIDKANKRQLFNFDLAVNNADRNTDFRILSNTTAYGGPINSFRKYYGLGGSLSDTPQFFSTEPQSYDKGGYLSQAKALIRQNEGWRDKPYADAPKGKNWRSVGYGFNDSGFREKYPEGISKHYEHGITKKQAEEELDYFLNKAEKQLKSIYGKQWNDFTDSQKAAILDTYYQRPASVAKGSRFYKAVTSGEDAGKYLGVAGYDKRNKIRQGVFGGSQDYVNLGIETGNTESNPSTLQEVTPFTPVVHDLDLSGITPTQAKALELNLASPVFDLSMFSKPSTPIVQQQTPAIGTVEDFLASYGDFEQNLFGGGGFLGLMPIMRPAQIGVQIASIPTDKQEIRKRLYNNINPYEYDGALGRLWTAVVENKREKALSEGVYLPELDNLWAEYLQIPENQRHKGNQILNEGHITKLLPARYKPTKGNENSKYYRLNLNDDSKKAIVDEAMGNAYEEGFDISPNPYNNHIGIKQIRKPIINVGENDVRTSYDRTLNWALRDFTIGRGRDNKGEYISYYDNWDIAPFFGGSDESMGIGKPFELYDRIYLDDYYDIPNNARGGTYLPEVVVTGKKKNKKAKGGHLAKPTLTNSKVNFSNQLNPLQQKGNVFDGGGWMDFFNSWNQVQGGNNYFGNNWKPSDGLQRTTSNGNAGDWMGVAGTTINTLANWGKEDPSLGRGGGYSMFGMAAYDIMKAIRNATKSKRESIGQKLAIPIYAQGGHLFDDGGSVGALGYANIANSALKLASNVKHQTELDIDPDKVYRSADRYGMGLDEAVANVNTNGDLLDLWANNSTVSANLSGRDFRDKSYFDDFLDSYAASWEGFNAGQNFGPWGAAIGAVIGGGSSVIGSIIGRNKAEDAAEESNRRLENANERRAHNLIAAAERVDKENDLRILQNMGANGGKLNMGFGLRNPFIMPDGTANPLFRAFGGGLTHKVGDIINVSPEEARYLKSLGYEFNTVG